MRKRDDTTLPTGTRKISSHLFLRFLTVVVLKYLRNCSYPRSEILFKLYKIDPTSMPKIVFSIKVFDDFTVDIWHGPKKLRSQDYSYMLGKENKCDRWTKLDCLINWISATPELEMPLKAQMEPLLANLRSVCCV
ncbi:hypothetical protein JTE90_002639 [Oedothorax gibbosus]|uniref:Uncharacterized protein n=1 Tax=Oedothorax gibbosus TaxID=931172 RepID=A0AAV6VHM7_9ARAC|nr:hypothetical protein JTE90_002639 [Oedothorax gibbosus]